MLKSKLLALTALVPLTLAIGAAPSNKTGKPVAANPADMQPTSEQAIAASIVQDVFANGRLAYRPRELNDALSADIYQKIRHL
jgi:hypothetical protein